MKNPSYAGDEVAQICPVVSWETAELEPLGAVMVRFVVTMPLSDDKRADAGPVSLTPAQCRDLAHELLALADRMAPEAKPRLN